MLRLWIPLLFIGFMGRASGQEVCGQDNSRQKPMEGFCVVLNPEVPVSEQELAQLQDKFKSFKQKYPRFMAKILENGYSKIEIHTFKAGEDGGVVVAETIFHKQKAQRVFRLYESYFTLLKDNPKGQDQDFSFADIALFHEFLHGYDEDGLIVFNNYDILGWEYENQKNAFNFGVKFFLGLYPLVLRHKTIKNEEMVKMKEAVTPLLDNKGNWSALLAAREYTKKWGYPSAYGVLRGPTETFAELGAYIALDPSAESYISSEVI